MAVWHAKILEGLELLGWNPSQMLFFARKGTRTLSVHELAHLLVLVETVFGPYSKQFSTLTPWYRSSRREHSHGPVTPALRYQTSGKV